MEDRCNLPHQIRLADSRFQVTSVHSMLDVPDTLLVYQKAKFIPADCGMNLKPMGTYGQVPDPNWRESTPLPNAAWPQGRLGLLRVQRLFAHVIVARHFDPLPVALNEAIKEPEFLYKYLNPEDKTSFRWIEQNEIFFKRADLFEDQNDCCVPIEWAMASQEARRQYLTDNSNLKLGSAALESLIARRESEIPVSIDARRAFDRLRMRKYTKDTRVLSLSSTIDSEFLRRKYANQGRGFAIEYHAKQLTGFIFRSDLGVFPEPVNYVEEIRPFPLEALTEDQTYVDILTFKLRKDWGEELEWRVIQRRLTELRRRSRSNPNVRILGKGFTLKVPDEVIRSVYVGKNCPEEVKLKIEKILLAKSINIAFKYWD